MMERPRHFREAKELGNAHNAWLAKIQRVVDAILELAKNEEPGLV